jgi:4-nitrophenyl phosphatase
MPTLERLARARCFLLDMDGTVYLGDRLIDGALAFLNELQVQGKTYLFLTNNSSKNSRLYAAKLKRLGIPGAENQVLTSGAATALHLQRRSPGARVYVVGTPALESEFETRGFKLSDDKPDFVILGFDTGITYAKLWRLCDLVSAGCPYIATHPDNVCPTETGYMPDIGATIAFVQAATGRHPDLIVGKPNQFMVEAAADITGLPVSDHCMIGDRLYTDIALGAAAGIPSVLVLSGETAVAEVADSPYQPDFVFADLGALAAAMKSQRAGLKASTASQPTKPHP